MEKLAIKELKLNQKIEIGTVTLSEQEIIEYALANDPLDFHINKTAAEKSMFKGLVASGSQVFNVVHKKGWIPLFGHSVICGVEVNHWKFLRPVYANQLIKGSVIPIYIKHNEDRNHVVITWKYEFTDMQEEHVQTLEVTVLHKL